MAQEIQTELVNSTDTFDISHVHQKVQTHSEAKPERTGVKRPVQKLL